MNKLIGIAALGVGAAAIWKGIQAKKKAEDSLSWKPADGKILSSDVTAEYSGGRYGRANRTGCYPIPVQGRQNDLHPR